MRVYALKSYILAEWIELKETLAEFQTERGKEMSDDKGRDDMTTKAGRKQKLDTSPMEFCCRSLAGGNVRDSLADLLMMMIAFITMNSGLVPLI